jgi:DNA mismatch repair protein MutS
LLSRARSVRIGWVDMSTFDEGSTDMPFAEDEMTVRVDTLATSDDRVLRYDAPNRSPAAPPVARGGDHQTPFRSILFPRPENRPGRQEEPAYFSDLNLDQIIESITSGRDEYDLRPFFYEYLDDPDEVRFRHEVMRDLEGRPVLEHMRAFAQGMRTVRGRLKRASNTSYQFEREGWFLEAVEAYCATIEALGHGHALTAVKSRGLEAFRAYVSGYVASAAFISLVAESGALRAALSEVRYCTLIRGGKVTVRWYDSESDYSSEVLRVFERFEQGAVKDYRVVFSDKEDMNPVEARIVDLVGRLYPDVFATLDEFFDRHADFLDDAIGRFDREIQFYIAYLEHLERLRSAGLNFCYPEVSSQSKEVFARETFDLALAQKLISDSASVVCNDFYLNDPERVLVISGPNQGGKTTLARTFGQLHHLAGIGCPVPGSAARLFIFDQMFTHFGSEEDLTNLSGKLEEDLLRLRGALATATAQSIIVMNEIFASTTLQDALALGTRVLDRIAELDLLCVYVTFVDELATLNESTVSMVSTIVPDNPAQRTYKVVRKPADGLAYAIAIAEKYDLTYDRLKERITP